MGTNDPVIEITLLDGRVLNYSADMLEDVDLSYCISIHKSQGAEFPVVLIPILKEHYIMLRRNLLYTAISRAKSKVILIGSGRPSTWPSTSTMWINEIPRLPTASQSTMTVSSKGQRVEMMTGTGYTELCPVPPK